jgi:hypothetical protein
MMTMNMMAVGARGVSPGYMWVDVYSSGDRQALEHILDSGSRVSYLKEVHSPLLTVREGAHI